MRGQIAVTAAERTARRAAGLAGLELNRGLNRVAGVPVTIFALGVWGAWGSVFGALKSCSAESVPYWVAVAGALAEAFAPLALALAIAVPLWMFHRHLRDQAEALSLEMDVACFDLAALLSPFSMEPARVATRSYWAVEGAERAARRKAAALGLEYRRGLSALAGIPVTAALAGFVNLGIDVGNTFVGSPWHAAARIGGAFVWLLPGLAIAILTSMSHAYLEAEAERLDHEMAIACKDLGALLR